jgi:hypothetical protein
MSPEMQHQQQQGWWLDLWHGRWTICVTSYDIASISGACNQSKFSNPWNPLAAFTLQSISVSWALGALNLSWLIYLTIYFARRLTQKVIVLAAIAMWCHVHIVTWAVRRMLRQEGRAEASSQAHFTLLQETEPNGQEASQLLKARSVHWLGHRRTDYWNRLCFLPTIVSLSLPPPSFLVNYSVSDSILVLWVANRVRVWHASQNSIGHNAQSRGHLLQSALTERVHATPMINFVCHEWSLITLEI